MKLVSYPNDRNEWNYELNYVWVEDRQQADLVLDADNCPHCGSCIVNAEITESVQFVGSSGDEWGETENEMQYQADDGPHSPDIHFARCGNPDCGKVLVDNTG